MNIIWLTTIFDDSAVSNILLQMLPYLKECKITVVSLENTDKISDNNTAYKSIETLKKLGIAHISLDCKRTQLFAMIRKLRVLIKSSNPDIVHAQLGRAYLALLLMPFTPIKKIATFHNNASYFNPLTYTLLKVFFRRFDYISAVSESALDSIQQSFDPTHKVPATVIYNPISLVDNPQYNSNKRADNADSHVSETIDKCYTLLVVGRLVEGKGHDLWIAMLPYLVRNITAYNGYKIKLLCAGAGVLATKIVQSCEKNGIADIVSMLGYRHDVPQLIQEADLVLFPSQNEGFGLVPCEAILLGKPVLTHNLSVMEELLQDDVWQVDCTDSQLFAKKALEMLTNGTQHQQALAKSEAHIRRLCASSVVADAYITLYRNVYSQ